MTKISSFLIVSLFSVIRLYGQFAPIPDYLYKGLEFKMPQVQLPSIPDIQVSITDFGAKSGGVELCSDAFRSAIEAVSNKGGGRVIIPQGIWLTGPITMKSNVELHTEMGALVIFSKDKSLYPVVESNFEGFSTYRCMSPINGRNLHDIAFTGKGIWDGTGEVWRMVKRDKLTDSQWRKLIASGGIVDSKGTSWYPSQQFMDGERVADMNVPRQLKTIDEFNKIKDFLRPVMVSLISCKKVLFDGPTFQNSPAWCIHPLMCEDFTLRNVDVRNPWFSQNGDGIDLESCKNSIVYDSRFDVGDDAICIKSGKDKEGRDRGIPNENLIVRNNTVFHGHGGVTVGSEMSGGVRNMHVSNCVFIGTDVGLRFKSNRGRGGVVENIYISHINMMNIPTQAISFNLYYGGKSASEDLEGGGKKSESAPEPVNESTPQFKNIVIKEVYCKGAAQAILLQGLPEMPLENVRIENVSMESETGMTCSDAKDIKVINCSLTITKGVPVVVSNTQNFLLEKFISSKGSKEIIKTIGEKNTKIVVR